MGGIVDSVMSIFSGPPDPPAPPNPYAVASAQAGADAATTRLEANLNRYNQYTPYGNLLWTDLGGDKWKNTVELSPEMKGLFDKYIDTSEGLTNYINQGLENVGTLFQPGNAPSADENFRQQIEDELYSRYTSRLDPQWDQAKNRMEDDLLNKGIFLGSDAYSDAQDDFTRGRTDAYQTAMSNAITGATSEMQNELGMDLQTRNQILNELNALRTGSQVTNPQFAAQQVGVNVPQTPLAQSIYNSYQGELDGYNAQISSQNSMMGGLANLAGSYMMASAMSDKRVKRNVQYLRTTKDGLRIYTFQYLWSPATFVGVIAQEVKKLVPEAVVKVGRFFWVDYSKLNLV